MPPTCSGAFFVVLSSPPLPASEHLRNTSCQAGGAPRRCLFQIEILARSGLQPGSELGEAQRAFSVQESQRVEIPAQREEELRVKLSRSLPTPPPLS